MNTWIICLMILLVNIGAGGAHAQDGSSATWSKILADKKLPEIVEMLDQSSTPSWPMLISDTSQQLNNFPSFKPSSLADVLFDDIGIYEQSMPHDESNSVDAIRIYTSLSRNLQKSGGYVNLCLADALNRLASGRLSEILVKNPTLADQASVILANLSCASFSSEKFVAMIHSESPQIISGNTPPSSVAPKDAEKQILAALGTSQEEVMAKFGYNEAGTRRLLHGLDLGTLLERMLLTDALVNVSLSGLVDYLKQGGTCSALNATDIRAFKAVMNGREFQHNSVFLGIDQVRVTGLLMFIKQFRSDEKKSQFVKIALQ